MPAAQQKPERWMARWSAIAGERSRLLALAGILSCLGTALALFAFLPMYKVLAGLMESAGAVPKGGGDMAAFGYMGLCCLAGGLVLAGAGRVCARKAAAAMKKSLAERMGQKAAEGEKAAGEMAQSLARHAACTLPGFLRAAGTACILLAALSFLKTGLALVCLLAWILCFGAQLITFPALRGQKTCPAALPPACCGTKKGGGKGFPGSIAFFTLLAANLFAVLLPAGMLIFMGSAQSLAFALTYLFFLLLVPGAAAPVLMAAGLASAIREAKKSAEALEKALSPHPGT